MTIASSPAPRFAVQASMFGPRQRHRPVVLAHVVGQRAAAAGALRDHDLDAQPGQQADGRLVDARRQHLLGAAGQQRHAALPRPLGRVDARRLAPGSAAARGGRQRQHRAQPLREHACPGISRPSGRARRAPARARRNRPGRGSSGPARAAAAVRARGGDRSARCRSGRDRPGACSSRRTGRSSCRTGRTGSDRHGAPPPRSRGGRSPACP